MSTSTDPCGDPRVQRSRRVILDATLELLGEVGYGALAVEAIAARAGVGKSTIYRHWKGKIDLIEDALRTLKSDVLVPDEGAFRERLTGYLAAIAAAVNDSTWSSCLPAMIDAGERDADVCRIHRAYTRGRMAVLEDFLTAAVEAGELPADTDVPTLGDALVGPILMRRLLLHEDFSPSDVGRIVDQLIGSG